MNSQRWYRLMVAMLCICFAACVPTHNVKPLPDFVEAALEPGDRVIVTTVDGRKSKFVVTEVRDGVIYGEGNEIALADVADLKKYSWERPDSPCGDVESLGCSVPLLVELASDSHAHYRNVFFDACADHDYCYRHGYRTYRRDRRSCDEKFLEDMRALCPVQAENAAIRLLQLMDDSIGSRTTCLAVAKNFHAGVERFGEDRFLTDESTYCEYDGPPEPPIE